MTTTAEAEQTQADRDFVQRYTNIHIWNRGFVSVADLVQGGQHLGTGGDGLTAGVFAQTESVELREGPISAEQTALAMKGFAEPPWFAAAVERLDSRVVFLVGEEGTGRRTGALNLLQRYTRSFDLRAVEADADLTGWDAGSTQARGYLVDGLLETRVTGLDAIALDRLKAELRRADACMVIVVRTTPGILAHVGDRLHTEPVRVVPPPSRMVFDAWLAATLPGPGQAEAALAALPDGLLDEILKPHLAPAQVVEIVTEVVRTAQGETRAGSLRERLSFNAAERAPQLLGAVRGRPEDLALLLSTCVFEHFDQAIVEEEAERLLALAAGRLHASGWDPEPDLPSAAGGFAFARTQRERLTAIEAYRAREHVRSTSTYSYVTEPVVFVRHLQGRALLEHVWREYREASGLLVEWLRQTPAADGRADRAGFILGQFAQWSSGHRALEPAEELARSAKPGDWRMAARALGAASTHPVLATAIKARLRGWSRSPVVARRCTVALACATEFGLARPETALRLLHAVLTGAGEESSAVETAVRSALVALFAEEANRTRLITTLLQWSRSQSTAERRAASATVAQLLRAAAPSGEAGEWWTRHLLSDSTQSPGLELIRTALMEPAAFETARAALLDWQRRAGTDPQRARVVEHLTDRLAPHLRGGVLRLFADLERAQPAPGSRRAARALADWRASL
ncbi:hypothetical protein [Streptomyces morookaense]|uniref:Uncharacterized protein n=1 Tax=Streptomyces morookaense TaxID=1970 RepID=A0A7Y7B195_STRMO|nr:hypothetical protein [Streptomyces morookaense]NVK77005.1 hypothetical protein [Streptomyces morookaense]GHF23296.1 hypothetical protein GCM10010359_26780 [Streptomyces morookaense]